MHSSLSVGLNKTFGELVLHPGFIAFSLIEAVGGGLWLALLTETSDSTVVPHLLISATITVEHIVQEIVLNSINNQGIVAQVSQAN